MIEVKKRVTEILRELGIPANMQGYEYLREGILRCIADPEMSYQVCRLYEMLAKTRSASGANVARTIRSAIAVGTRNTGTKAWGKYFVLTERRITNGEFIAAIADFVRLEQEEQEEQKTVRGA